MDEIEFLEEMIKDLENHIDCIKVQIKKTKKEKGE